MTENDSTPPQNRDPDGAPTTDTAETDPSNQREDRPRPSQQMEPLRLVGLGTELAGFTVVCIGIGYAIDSARGHPTRYATALGALIGFTLGMIRFIRNVKKLTEN